MLDFSFLEDERFKSLDYTTKRTVFHDMVGAQAAQDQRFSALDEPTRQTVLDDLFAAKAPKESPGFLKSVVGGLYDTKQTFEGAGALVGGAIEKYTPFEDLGRQTKDYWLNEYKATGAQAKPYDATMTFGEADSLGDYWTWAKEQSGRLMPTMAAAATGAGAGAVMARGVTEVGAGTMIRSLAEKAVEKNVQKAMATKIGQELGENVVRDQVAKATILEIGAKAGMFGTVAAMESGGNYIELAEKGINAPFSSLSTGTVAASLELLGGNIKLIERFFGPAASKVIGKALAKPDGIALKGASKALVDVAENMSTEAMQEGGQELLSILNVVANTDEKLMTGKNWTRIKESAAAGALGGFGGGMVEVATKQNGEAAAPPAIDKETMLGNIQSAAPTLSDTEVEAVKERAMQHGITAEEVDSIVSAAREPGEVDRFAQESSAYLKEKNAPKQPGRSYADDLFAYMANENTNFEMDRMVGEYQNRDENHVNRLMGEWGNDAVDLANRETLRQGRKLLPEPVRDFTLQGTPYTPKEDLTPAELRPAIAKMEAELKSGTTGGVITNGRPGNEQEVTGRFVGTNPEWFQKKTVEAYDKANGTDYAKAVNKLSVLTAIGRMRKGEALNKTQAKAWEYLKVQAKELKQVDPELRLHQTAQAMEQRGFELIGKDMPAGELRPGDKVVLGNSEEYHHAGYDRQGNAVLEGKDTKRLDPFDMLHVEGIKRGNGKIQREDMKADPAHVAMGMDNPDVALAHFEKAIPKEDRAIMADVFALVRKNGMHRTMSFPQQLFNFIGGFYFKRTNKQLAILGANADNTRKEASHELTTKAGRGTGVTSSQGNGSVGSAPGADQGVVRSVDAAGAGLPGAGASTAVNHGIAERHNPQANALADKIAAKMLGGASIRFDYGQYRRFFFTPYGGAWAGKESTISVSELSHDDLLTALHSKAAEYGLNIGEYYAGTDSSGRIGVQENDRAPSGHPGISGVEKNSGNRPGPDTQEERAGGVSGNQTAAISNTSDASTQSAPSGVAHPADLPGADTVTASSDKVTLAPASSPITIEPHGSGIIVKGDMAEVRAKLAAAGVKPKGLPNAKLGGLVFSEKQAGEVRAALDGKTTNNPTHLSTENDKTHDKQTDVSGDIESQNTPVRETQADLSSKSQKKETTNAQTDKTDLATPVPETVKDAPVVAGGVPDAVAGGVIEPWQMTKAEYVDGHYRSPGMHREAVRQAIERGDIVPKNVLADYRDLTPQGAIKAQPSQSDESAFVKQASNKETTPKQEDASPVAPPDGLQSNKPAAEMTASELLRAAADKMDAAEKPAKIEDFGEKIGGARKDFASTMASAKKEDTASVPLSKSWPEPNYEKMLKDGADPYAVGFARAAREEVPTKPRKSWQNKSWVEQVEMLRQFTEDVVSGALPKDKVIAALSPALRDSVGFRAEMYAQLGHGKSLAGVKVGFTHYGLDHGKENVDLWEVTRPRKATAFSNMPDTLGKGNTRDEAIAGFLSTYNAMEAGPDSKERTTTFEIYRYRGKEGSWIGKKVGKSYIDLKRFDDAAAAREYLKGNQVELESLLEKAKYIPSERRDANRERVGPERSAANVTPELFQKTFGFRGVEFGNWVNADGERQQQLNMAHDALADLAEVLGIPTQAISLNGELGLAFGARGKGGKNAAAANYEPGRIVINLTRNNGAGSLAHEWFHAMDSYFSRERSEPSGYITDKPWNRGANDKTRAEVFSAVKAVNEAIAKTGLKERSANLDGKRSKDYWSTGTEMGARAFENYVIDKLNAQGFSNDYLANIQGEHEYLRDMAAHMLDGPDGDFDSKDYYPYLTDKEVPGVAKAFDNLFATIKTEETDKGVKLYSKTTTKTGTTVAQVETELRAVLKRGYDKLTASGKLRVVRSVAELQENIGLRSKSESGNVSSMSNKRAGDIPTKQTQNTPVGGEILYQQSSKQFLGDNGKEYTGVDASASLSLILDDDFKNLTGVTKKEFQDKGGSIYFVPAGSSEENSIHPISGEIVLSESLKNDKEELRKTLIHELTHWEQIQSGTAPTNFYASPEESISIFMEYLSDPAEVRARFNAEGRTTQEYEDFMGQLSFAKSEDASNSKPFRVGETRIEESKKWRMTPSYLSREIEEAKAGRKYRDISRGQLRKNISELESIIRPRGTSEIVQADEIYAKLDLVKARNPISDSDISNLNLLQQDISREWQMRRLGVGKKLADNDIEYYSAKVLRVEVEGVSRRGDVNPIIIESKLQAAGIDAFAVGPNEIQITLNKKTSEKLANIGAAFRDAGARTKTKSLPNRTSSPIGGGDTSPLYSKDGSIAGTYDPRTGQITLVADNVKPGQAEYVMLHEGLHKLMREDALFSKQHDAILDQFEKLKATDYRVQDAFRRVPEDTPAHLVREEALAYFIENKANHETSLFKKLIANIRMWLMRMGIPMKNLATDDLVAMVTQGVKRMANQATVEDSASVGELAPVLHSKRSVVDDIFDTAPAQQGNTFTADLDIQEEGKATKLWDYLVFKAQDKFNSLKKVQEKAKRSRGLNELPESEDAYLAELRYHGQAGARIEDFHDEHVEPMIEAIHKAGLTLEDVGRYLWARHAPEANAQLAKINPEMENNTALSGMSNDEAAEILVGFGSKRGALDDIGKRVDAITKMRRDLLLESGLEKAETVSAWEKAYRHYVPLHREGKGGSLPSQGRGFDTRGKEKRRTGSEKDVVNILAHVVAQYEKTAIKAEKAKVGRALLEFVKSNPNPDMWEVDKVTFKPTFDKDGLVQYREDKGFILADNVLVVKVDGEDNRITFNQGNDHAKRIVSSMKNLGAEQSGILVRALATVNRVLAIVNTSANPEFVVSNLFRDLQTAGFNLNATEAKDLKVAIFKDVAKAWRGIRAAQKKDYHHPWARNYREFRQAGAKTGWMEFYKDIEHREAKLQKMLDEMGDGSMMKIKRGLNAIEQFVEHGNTAVENAIRLSTFINARKAGISEARAAALAKELTVNFNRKGDAGQMLNALYLFYNASVQGTVRMFQAAKNPKVMALMGGTVVAAAMLDMMNRAIGGDDDDGESFYDKLPGYVTERNLIIMRPGGDYFKIPLPWGYNVLHVMGQEIGKGLDDSYRGYNAGKSALRVLGAAASSFSPIGSEAGLLQMISPTITDPVVQWAENKDWSGRKLRPDSSFDRDKPESQKYWNSVREPSRWVAEKLNELTGGDQVRPGKIDISPELFDLWIDTFTGGAGRFMADMVATPMKALKGEKIEAHTIPLARKLYGSQSPTYARTTFYEHIDSIGTVKRQLEFYKNEPEKLAEIRAEYGDEIKMLGVAKLHEKAVARLRKERRAVEASKSLPDADKKERLEKIDEKMMQMMQRFNRLYRERVLDRAA